MYFGYTCDFRSLRRLPEILSAWNASGPLVWHAFENDDRGAYLVARDPALNLRIRVYGDAPQYSLEMDADVAESRHDAVTQQLLSTVRSVLLPAIAATDIRDTSHETR